MVLTRYWRREEDGSYFIMYQSSEHADYPETSKQVRGNILGSVFTIAPQKGAHAMPKSLVTHVVRYDPKGYRAMYMVYFCQCSCVDIQVYLSNWAMV